MNVTFPFGGQLEGAWDTAKGYLGHGLGILGSQIAGAFGVEHDIQTDRHATIHATGSISERTRTTPMGEWIKHPFSASDFATQNSSTWVVTAATSGNPTPLAYTLIGTTLILRVDVPGTGSTSTLTVTAAPAYLSMAIPDGYRVATNAAGTFAAGTAVVAANATNAGTQLTAFLEAVPGDAFIRLYRLGSDWVTGTVTVQGQLIFEVAG